MAAATTPVGPVGRRATAARVAFWSALLACALAGRWPLLAAAGVVLLLVYVELRGAFGPAGPVPSVVAGAAAVGVLCWLGIEGRASDLPWVVAGLVLAMLTLRIVLNELGLAGVEGAVWDVASTTATAALVGLLGAHVLLVRALPESGFRGILAFAFIVAGQSGASALADRFGARRPIAPALSRLTWTAVGSGVVGAAAAGAIAGVLLDPPLDPAFGTLLGAALGILLPAGSLAAAAVSRGSRSGLLPVLGSPFRTSGGVLFSSIAYYWVFRSLVH